jgi:5'-deoxynucleotidase YfbR-like HD superfamily hydrolase
LDHAGLSLFLEPRAPGTIPQVKKPVPAPPRAWQRMLSGRRLDLLDPSPLDVEIEDIAHGLARVARWNGQTRGPHIFSVAQHSILVARFTGALDPGISARWRLMALLHDAPEYVIGDIISPFKAAVGETYKAVENRILAAIHLRFGLPAEPPAAFTKLLKKADRAAAFIEATRLAGFSADEAVQFFGRPGVRLANVEALIAPTPSEAAERAFLEAFGTLDAESAAAP